MRVKKRTVLVGIVSTFLLAYPSKFLWLLIVDAALSYINETWLSEYIPIWLIDCITPSQIECVIPTPIVIFFSWGIPVIFSVLVIYVTYYAFKLIYNQPEKNAEKVEIKKSNDSICDDMLLMELFDYLKKNVDYSEKFKELDGSDVAFKIAMDIKDNASLNRLDLFARVYGKQFDQFLDPINQLEKIKLDDWNDFSFTMNFEEGIIQAENENNNYDGNIYRDIQVERKQVTRIWPEEYRLTFEQEFNAEAARREPDNESNKENFIPLSEAAQKLYTELRHFDKEHWHVTLAESFRDSDDGVLGYFAIVIGLRGEIFGKRPPSTKLEKISPEEFKKGTFKNDVSEFFRYNGKVAEYIELAIEPRTIPKILDSLKADTMVG